ncbi:hypothetical protein [Bdellovibrio sp. BCCA]|uniref:hypothetical protein n=1 Tax=Bdellovibrio sp. BCCA TaxID=3136281 RepID=UPI0030F0EF1A
MAHNGNIDTNWTVENDLNLEFIAAIEDEMNPHEIIDAVDPNVKLYSPEEVINLELELELKEERKDE